MTISSDLSLDSSDDGLDRATRRRNRIRDLAMARGLVIPDEDVSPPIAKIGDDELEPVLDVESEAYFDRDRVDVDVDTLVVEP